MSEIGRRSVLLQLKKIPHGMKLTVDHRLNWRYRFALGCGTTRLRRLEDED